MARVDVDVIESRAGFRIDYEMPPVPPVPDSMAGRSSTALATVPDTPGVKFTLTPFRVIPPAALGGYASYSADEAKKSLMENYEVREVNGDALMRAAVEGNLDVVQLCLAKDVRRRLQSSLALRNDLEEILRSSREAEAAVASIAVLPFVDMSPARDQEYFCEGIAEELINALTKIGELRIASRTSAFAFRGKDVSIRRIGEELGVAAVLEGSVRKAGNKLRVTAQLVNVADGYHQQNRAFGKSGGRRIETSLKIGEGPIESPGNAIGQQFQPLHVTLLVERPVLLQCPPSEPAQTRRRNQGDGYKQDQHPAGSLKPEPERHSGFILPPAVSACCADNV